MLSFVCSQTRWMLSAARSTLVGPEMSRGAIMRMSSAALRPSVEMVSMLSSLGDTARAATFSARVPRVSMNCSSSTVG
ncbi:hypothetical protein ACFPRL_06720 [Pseudoclavibacter helvolus]